MSTRTENRQLTVEHRDYGVQDDPEKGLDLWVGPQGLMVGSYWWAKGQGRIWANVPASEVTVSEWWPCSWGSWNLSGCSYCGNDTTEFDAVDGEPYCTVHLMAIAALTAMDEHDLAMLRMTNDDL